MYKRDKYIKVEEKLKILFFSRVLQIKYNEIKELNKCEIRWMIFFALLKEKSALERVQKDNGGYFSLTNYLVQKKLEI